MTWDETQSYCRENHTDLVTIQSLDDMKTLSMIAAGSNVTSMIWTGLRRYDVKSWMWSSGDTPGLADYDNWASLLTSSQDCGALRVDGKWLGVDCNTALPFVCQTGECHISLIPIHNQWQKCNNLIIFSSETTNHHFRVLSGLDWVGTGPCQWCESLVYRWWLLRCHSYQSDLEGGPGLLS